MQMTIDQCIELAGRQCWAPPCVSAARCDEAGECLYAAHDDDLHRIEDETWPYEDHPADDPR